MDFKQILLLLLLLVWLIFSSFCGSGSILFFDGCAADDVSIGGGENVVFSPCSGDGDDVLVSPGWVEAPLGSCEGVGSPEWTGVI